MISGKDGAAIDYTGFELLMEVTVSGTVLTMGADAKANTAYDVKSYLLGGRSYDMPAFKVKFVDSKTYIADMARQVSHLFQVIPKMLTAIKLFYAERRLGFPKAGIVNFYKVT